MSASFVSETLRRISVKFCVCLKYLYLILIHIGLMYRVEWGRDPRSCGEVPFQVSLVPVKSEYRVVH
jgi:hypothetical protein